MLDSPWLLFALTAAVGVALALAGSALLVLSPAARERRERRVYTPTLMDTR